MIERSPRRKKFFDSNNNPRVVPNPRGKLRQPGTKDLLSVLRTKDEQFVDFIMLFLRWEPMERATPGEAMRHPWIAECFQQEPQRPHPPVGATAGIGRSAPLTARLGSAQHPVVQRELPIIGAGQPTAGSSGTLLKKHSKHRITQQGPPQPQQHQSEF
jgi:dual specificity tyrosine-phosphorylation-regulated kinase 2/3/4